MAARPEVVVQTTPRGNAVPDIKDALDLNRFDQIHRQADLGLNLWQSLELAAARGDRPACVALCEQIKVLTRETFSLVRALGTVRTDA